LSIFILRLRPAFWSRGISMYLVVPAFTSIPIALLEIFKASSFFCEAEKALQPAVTRWRGDGVGTAITRLVILRSNWASGSRDSSVALQWSFHNSFSRQFTDLCRRFTSSLRAVTLVTWHCLRRRFFTYPRVEKWWVVWFPPGLLCWVCGCILFGFYRIRLTRCCRFIFKLLWRGRLPVSGHFWLFRRLRAGRGLGLRVGVVASRTRSPRTTWFRFAGRKRTTHVSLLSKRSVSKSEIRPLIQYWSPHVKTLKVYTNFKES